MTSFNESEVRMVPITIESGEIVPGRVALVTELPQDKEGNFKAITACRRIESLNVCDRVVLVDLCGELNVAEVVSFLDYLLMLDARIIILPDEKWSFLDNIPTAN